MTTEEERPQRSELSHSVHMTHRKNFSLDLTHSYNKIDFLKQLLIPNHN